MSSTALISELVWFHRVKLFRPCGFFKKEAELVDEKKRKMSNTSEEKNSEDEVPSTPENKQVEELT